MLPVKIKEITPQQTIVVRHPVLRSGKPIQSCHFEGDDDASTVHFGLFSADILAGVASLFTNSIGLFKEESQFQLRGMAVLDAFQGRGYGMMLLRHSEEFAIRNKAEILWFNARAIAVGFYQSDGYQIIGDAFEISDVGVHYVMYKHL